METSNRNAQRIAYLRLLARYRRNQDGTVDERWRLLMAAHVVGQSDLRLHWDSHVRMLRLAWSTRDLPEVAGQLVRLALVPVGHAVGRLPSGNVGRATVNAFRVMQPPEDVRKLIAWSMRGG